MAHTLKYKDGKGLQSWLEDKPIDWAKVIAVRNALRVFPLVYSVADLSDEDVPLEHKQQLILSAWRALFISWAACKYLNQNMRDASAAATNATAATAGHKTNSYSAAAAATAYAVAATNNSYAGAGAAAYAAAAATAAATAATTAVTYPYGASAEKQIWVAASSDAQFLETAPEQAAFQLITTPLWIEPIAESEGYQTNAPEFTRRAFDRFVNLGWVRNSPWDLISDWFVAVLPNDKTAKARSLFGERADIVIATQPDEFWDREPLVVLDAIGEIVADRYLASRVGDDPNSDSNDLFSTDDETVEIPLQQPAPIETAIANDTVVRVHTDHMALRPDIEAIHTILVAEAAFLAGRIDRQAPDVVASVNSVSQELGARLDDMRIYGVGYWAGVLNQIAGRIDEAVLDDAAGRFAGFLTNLNLFLRHSEDWNAYIRTAQNAELAGVIGSEAQTLTPQIIQKLAESSGIVAEEVSGPLASLNKALLDAPLYNPETAYGLYRSLANVLQAVVELSLKDGVSHLRSFAKDVGADFRKKAVSWTAGGLLLACGSSLLVLSKAIPSMFGFLNPILRFLGVG